MGLVEKEKKLFGGKNVERVGRERYVSILDFEVI